MASSVFTVNGTTAPCEVLTTWGGTVNLALVSTAGVTTISWSVESTSSAVITSPTITPAGSPSGATASFTFVDLSASVNGWRGGSVVVKCTINAGTSTESTTRAVVGVGRFLPGCPGEEYARSATYGWGGALNLAVAQMQPIAWKTGTLTAGAGATNVLTVPFANGTTA